MAFVLRDDVPFGYFVAGEVDLLVHLVSGFEWYDTVEVTQIGKNFGEVSWLVGSGVLLEVVGAFGQYMQGVQPNYFLLSSFDLKQQRHTNNFGTKIGYQTVSNCTDASIFWLAILSQPFFWHHVFDGVYEQGQWYLPVTHRLIQPPAI